MSVFTRRGDFATTIDTLHQCVDRNCFTVRHVTLTADFLLGFYEFLEDQIAYENNIPNIAQKYDHWDDLDYYNSIEAAIATNKQQNKQHCNKNIIDTKPQQTTGNIHQVNALEFWNCAIDDDISTKQILADIIMVFPEITNHKFEKLHLSFNFLDDETLQILSNALIYLYHLNELRIINNHLTYLSFPTLNRIFAHQYCTFKQTIQILDLSGNDALIRDHKHALRAFKLFVDELLLQSKIKCLYLGRLPLKSVHIQYLSKWIIDKHNICTLTLLDLSDNTFDLTMIRSLCDNIINNSICRLESLILKNCTFQYAAADYFGSHLCSNYALYKLDLSGMDLEGFIAFSNSENVINIACLILSNLQCRSQPNWYKLKMDDISDALIKIVTKKCLFIHTLHLNRGDLNNDEVQDLCAFLCNHPWIRTLLLSNNFITNDCIKSLCFCVNQTKKEAIKQTQMYCNNIVDATELLLFEEEYEQNEMTMDCNENINVYTLIEAYLLQYCKYRVYGTKQNIPKHVIKVCVGYFFPKVVMEDMDTDGDMDKMESLFLGFKYKQFPYDLAMMIVEFVFNKPMNGLKSVYLSGNALHPTFSACFRNTDLISKDMLRKISLTKSRYTVPAENSFGLVTSRHLEKFIKTMY